jgi:Putative peptidoglycan binding domain
VAAAVGAIVAVGGAAGVILATSLTGSTQAASQPAKASGSSTVQRRDLVETDTESGTLSYADSQTVFNRVSGTVTALPTVGQVIKAGGTLYRVDGAPVVLFNGGVPAYRDLSASDTAGADVKELKQNLKALGFDPDHEITVNDTFDAATTAAVERWQQSVGETQTGTISLGQVVFLPGSQRITTVDAVLGSNGGSGASGASGSGTATTTSTTPGPHAEFVDLTTSSAESSDGSWSKQGSSADQKPPTCRTGGGTGQPGANQTNANQTSDKPPACKPASGSGSGSGNGAGQTTQGQPTGQTLAALLALLKAQTLELQHSHTAGGSSSAPTSGGRAGGTTTAQAGSGRGGGGGFAEGGSASAATAGSGSRSGGGFSGGSGGSAGSGSSGGSGGGSSTGSGAASGASAASASAQPILQTTSTKLVVTVDLDATMQSEAVVHEPVTVEMPDGSTVGGRITEVSPVAQSTSSSSSSSSSAGASASASTGGSSGGSSSPSATVPVTITLTGHRHVAGLDQAAVSVNFEQQKASNVLSVPVTALLATAGGGYAVQEAAPTHRLIPVTPGLFAAGFVQISGSGVSSGLQVTDSQG